MTRIWNSNARGTILRARKVGLDQGLECRQAAEVASLTPTLHCPSTFEDNDCRGPAVLLTDKRHV